MQVTNNSPDFPVSYYCGRTLYKLPWLILIVITILYQPAHMNPYRASCEPVLALICSHIGHHMYPSLSIINDVINLLPHYQTYQPGTHTQ